MEKNKILIVDDVAINREMLAEIFRDEYIILEAENGKEGIQLLVENFAEVAAVLLDLAMPIMDGFQMLDILSRRKLITRIPIIMTTGETSVECERRGYEYGIVDYIHKPFHGPVVKQMVKNAIALYAYKTQLEMLVRKQTEQLEAQNEMLKNQAEKLSKMNAVMIDTMSNVVEFRDMESGQHVKRIRLFTKVMAEEIMNRYPEYGLTQDIVEIISQASAMHDIGKITVPDQILLKPGKLTKDEFEVMKGHTTRGSEMIATLIRMEDEEYFNYCYDICRHHHERYDGKGYPDALKGDDISIAAQIVSIVDVYDALVSERVYKPAFDKEKAYHMIINGECGCFSPKLLETFAAVKGKLEELADQLADHYGEEEIK